MSLSSSFSKACPMAMAWSLCFACSIALPWKHDITRHHCKEQAAGSSAHTGLRAEMSPGLQDAESFLLFTNAAPLRTTKWVPIFTTDRSIMQKFKSYYSRTKQVLCLCLASDPNEGPNQALGAWENKFHLNILCNTTLQEKESSLEWCLAILVQQVLSCSERKFLFLL